MIGLGTQKRDKKKGIEGEIEVGETETNRFKQRTKEEREKNLKELPEPKTKREKCIACDHTTSRTGHTNEEERAKSERSRSFGEGNARDMQNNNNTSNNGGELPTSYAQHETHVSEGRSGRTAKRKKR